MKAIPCDISLAYQIINAERDSLELVTNSPHEVWRFRLNDCHAIAYQGKVLPQGRNQQRIADLLSGIKTTQEEIL